MKTNTRLSGGLTVRAGPQEQQWDSTMRTDPRRDGNWAGTYIKKSQPFKELSLWKKEVHSSQQELPPQRPEVRNELGVPEERTGQWGCRTVSEPGHDNGWKDCKSCRHILFTPLGSLESVSSFSSPQLLLCDSIQLSCSLTRCTFPHFLFSQFLFLLQNSLQSSSPHRNPSQPTHPDRVGGPLHVPSYLLHTSTQHYHTSLSLFICFPSACFSSTSPKLQLGSLTRCLSKKYLKYH